MHCIKFSLHIEKAQLYKFLPICVVGMSQSAVHQTTKNGTFIITNNSPNSEVIQLETLTLVLGKVKRKPQVFYSHINYHNSCLQ